MKRWWLVIALLLSLGANVGILASLAFQARSAGGPADAATPPAPDVPAPRGERLPTRMVHRMADELGLEGEKRAAFVEIQRTFFEQTISARSRMARLQDEIRREITSEDPDREALDALLGELSAAHTDLERAFVNNLLDSREVLDAEQEMRFRHFLRRMRHVRADVEQRFRERWRRRGEHGPPFGARGRPGPGLPPNRNRPGERG